MGYGIGPLPKWSIWRKLFSSVSPVSFKVPGEFTERPHAFVTLDIVTKKGEQRTVRFPIWFDKTAIPNESDILRFTVRSLEVY